MKIYFKKRKRKSEEGAIALISILILLVILLSLGLTMTFSGFTQNRSTSNQYKTAIAFYAAESGVKDAIQKITLNKNYNNAGGYVLPIGESVAYITVNILSSPTEITAGQTEIISAGTTENSIKKIRTIVGVNINGKIETTSWEEI